jgi:hypothetical protein
MANNSPQAIELRQLQVLAKGAVQCAEAEPTTVNPEAEKPKPNLTGLPDQLKRGIEALSGLSVDHVSFQYNSAQPAQLNWARSLAQAGEKLGIALVSQLGEEAQQGERQGKALRIQLQQPPLQGERRLPLQLLQHEGPRRQIEPIALQQLLVRAELGAHSVHHVRQPTAQARLKMTSQRLPTGLICGVHLKPQPPPAWATPQSTGARARWGCRPDDRWARAESAAKNAIVLISFP